MAMPAKTERNNAICDEWRTGETTIAALAEKHGLSVSRVRIILQRGKATLPAEVQRARWLQGLANGKNSGGRPRTWPDCPQHLRSEYNRLRRTYGFRAAVARQILEGAV
jgi:hypothetical protein